MKVAITGGTGFLGSHLTRALLCKGYKVLLLKRSFSNVERIVDILPRLCAVDIDLISLTEIFGAHSDIEVIIHAATCYGHDIKKGDDPTEIVEANVDFPTRLLEVAGKSSCKLFVNTDSFFSDATSNYGHLSAYSKSKRKFRDLCQLTNFSTEMQIVNMRLFHVYGKCDGDSKFVQNIVHRCLTSTDDIELTDGMQCRDFINVKDVVEAYVILLRRLHDIKNRYTNFDVGSGALVSIRDFVELVHRTSRSQAKLKFGALPNRPGEFDSPKADLDGLNSIGWRPKIKLEEGVAQLILGS